MRNKTLIIADIIPATIHAIDVNKLNVVTNLAHSKIGLEFSI